MGHDGTPEVGLCEGRLAGFTPMEAVYCGPPPDSKAGQVVGPWHKLGD
jgi:hypothetical protein